MGKFNFEYAKGRFIDSRKIVGANIYEKANPKAQEPGQPEKVIRIAFDVDTANKEQSVVYSDPLPSMDAARAAISAIPE